MNKKTKTETAYAVKNVCYSFSRTGTCQRKACSFKHVCGHCGLTGHTDNNCQG